MNAPPAADRDAWQVPQHRPVFWCGRQHPYCLVIPVINEGERIRRLLERMQALSLATVVDIVIVDGGSKDGSVDDESWLQAHGVRGLLIKTGPGKLSAQLRCAYAFALDAGYDGIVTIDGNDKDDPEAVPRFVAALREGFDFVQASRFLPGGYAGRTPLLRTLAVRCLHAPLLSWSSGFAWTDTTQGFRAYSRRLLLDPRVAPFRDVFDTYELLAHLTYIAPRLGYRCTELPSRRIYPPGATPTKIAGWSGHLQILRILINACRGRYTAGSGRR